MSRFVSLLALALAITPSLTPAQRSFYVGSAEPFTDIQSAIDAASPGDRVLVRPGAYSGFVVDKAIAIVGSGATLFSANAPGEVFTIRDLPAGSDFAFPVLQSNVVLGVQVHWVALTLGANPPTLTNNVGYTHGF